MAASGIDSPAMEILNGAGSTLGSRNPTTSRGRTATLAGSAQVFRSGKATRPDEERYGIAKAWQVEMYRYAEIIGEARYAATLFSAIAGRAEIGVSEAQALAKKAVWVKSGPEVDAFAEIAPTVRERSKLIRDFMLHWIIAGECYLIAREKRPTDPGYIDPPIDPATGEPHLTWEEYLRNEADVADLFDPDYDPDEVSGNPNVEDPIWEIVAVTEIRKQGAMWQVRHDNGVFLDLHKNDPVIRMWNPNPKERREAWSAFMAMEGTLREIEWFTKHIFTQVRSRMLAAGVWFLPNNLTFDPPPLDAIGGDNPEETLAAMNEAQQFMVSLAHASTGLLDGDTVAFPSVVMADPIALAMVDQAKLIQFWSELDDKAMTMRSDAVRRFALGMDLPPEQVLGSSGLAVTGAGGSAGSVNHWGVWANEEQTISAHVEPALDAFTGVITCGYLRLAVTGTTLVIAYDTTSLRLKQDRSEESIKLYNLGLISGEVTVREVGFDPENDMMDDQEFRRWVLTKIVTGSFAPEQMQAALLILGIDLGVDMSALSGAKGTDGKQQPSNTDGIEHRGAPREQHDHSPAPYSYLTGLAEGLVLRALEKNGNRLLNDGKRGKSRDRLTAPHEAHLTLSGPDTLQRTVSSLEFDFSLAPTMLEGVTEDEQDRLVADMRHLCASLTNEGRPYTREALLEAVKGL